MAKKTSEDAVKNVATVYSKTGQTIRTYTRDIHGEEFEGLAAQMSAQYPGSYITAL